MRLGIIIRVAAAFVGPVALGACGDGPPEPATFTLRGMFTTDTATTTGGATVIDVLANDSLRGTLVVSSLETAPQGTLTVQKCERCLSYTTAGTITGTPRDGDSVYMLLGFSTMNPRLELRGTYKGDSLSGRMVMTYQTSTRKVGVGAFIAKR